MNSNRIAEFQDSDDALRFCKMKGADYTICAGIRFAWAVRPKMRHELNADPSQSYIDEDIDREDDE